MNEFVAIVLLIIAGCLFGIWGVVRGDRELNELVKDLSRKEFARKMGIDDGHD